MKELIIDNFAGEGLSGVPELNQIIHADCMDIMRDIPDKYFELAIVDPPYGTGKVWREGGRNLAACGKYGNKKWNQNPPTKDYFEELFRITKNQIIWGANHFISNMPFNSPSWIIWDKNNYNSVYADCELAWTSFSQPARIFKYMWNGMMQGKSIKEGDIQQGNKKLNEIRIHPTQKPVALYRWILQKYAKPGDKIIDTHSGSGSCAVACYLEHHDFLAIEKDADYHPASVARLDEVKAQGRLF